MKILTIGDIVSKQGCEYLRSTLPALKRELEADIVIANGENSASETEFYLKVQNIYLTAVLTLSRSATTV